jgi:hypothetical protein
MFIFTWMFDKLGYMPKIDMQIGKVNLDVKPWPFPEVEVKNLAEEPTPIKKPAVKKPAAKKTIRTKKVK